MTNRDQGLLIGVGTLAIGAAGWFFWLSPAALAVGQANRQLGELDQQKTTLAARLAFVDATARDLAANADALKLLTLAAPTTGGLENLLSSFDGMAAASGVTLASFQPATASDQPAQLTLTVSASGSFTALQAFVASIEQNVRPLTIQTLSLASAIGANGAAVVTGSFSITTPTVATVLPPVGAASATSIERTP